MLAVNISAVSHCSGLFFTFTVQQARARSWTPPWTAGNLASRTVWATRFTSCVSTALNWWVQKAGFVRKAWPGAASSPPAKVSLQSDLAVMETSPRLALTLTHPGFWPTGQLHSSVMTLFVFSFFFFPVFLMQPLPPRPTPPQSWMLLLLPPGQLPPLGPLFVLHVALSCRAPPTAPASQDTPSPAGTVTHAPVPEG